MALEIKCWVPHCASTKVASASPLEFFPLPRDHKYRETWLALTGKTLTIPEEQVYYCNVHFRESAFQRIAGKIIGLTSTALPFFQMPEMICRTCMVTISNTGMFCVVSATLPSPVPSQFMQTEFIQFRPEPLYHVLTFCIPNLNLKQNPPPLVCLDCYTSIWEYYTLKITANATEKQIRGNLSPEEYGRVVQCRCCPVVTGTRFFFLNTSQEMGRLLKQLFLNDLPLDVVPLKVCLKCWNKLYKLAQFHKRSMDLDRMIQRCSELHESSAYPDMLSPHILSVVKRQMRCASDQPLQSPVSIIGESSPSTSSTSELALVYLPSAEKAPEKTASVKQEPVPLSKMTKQEAINEMPKLVPQVEVGETKAASNAAVKKRINFSPAAKLTIANLMLKHGTAPGSDLSPAERIKLDFEVWVNVVKDFYALGHTNKLESIQAVWNRMKRDARFAQKVIGPETHLDYLVNSYIRKVDVNTDSTTDSSALESEDADSRDNDQDDDGDEDDVQASTGAVKEKNKTSAAAVNCVTDPKPKSVPSQHPKDKNKAKVGKQRRGRSHLTAVKPVAKPKGRKKKGLRARGTYTRRTQEEMLELVRAVRKKYNGLIELGAIGASRCPPWRRILEQMVEEGYWNCTFAKLYYMWTRMKISATVHAKNGQDPVDEEMWDLLQLHADVQKGLCKSKRLSPVAEESPEEQAKESGSSLPFKKRKLSPALATKVVAPQQPEATLSRKRDGRTPPKQTKNASPVLSPGNPKRKYRRLSEDEKFELLALVEKEMHAMIQGETYIKGTVVDILKKITFKDVSANTMVYMWQRLSVAAHDRDTQRTPLQKRCGKLLKLYRRNRAPRKVNVFPKEKSKEDQPLETSSPKIRTSASKERTTPKKPATSPKKGVTETQPSTPTTSKATSNKKRSPDTTQKTSLKLALVAVVRSFGNEVFQQGDRYQNRSARHDFWKRVTAEMHSRGYSLGHLQVRTMWFGMLQSAKLTWAQDDRTPKVGDREIIDFMTEVIKGKERSKSDNSEGLRIGENSDGGNVPEEDHVEEKEKEVANVEEKEEETDVEEKQKEEANVEEEQPNVVEQKEQQTNLQEDVELNIKAENSDSDYDYVSLEDIKKQYGLDMLTKPQPVVLEGVIEISDSEDE